MKIAVAGLVSGGALVLLGMSILEQGGPCTVHLGLGGMGLMVVGAGFGVAGLLRLIVVTSPSQD